MKYKEFLKKLNKCPFCNLEKNEIIKKNKYAKIILSKAPYREDHLLIIPNRHALFLKELTKKEREALFELVFWAEKKLSKKHKNMSILYREGDKVKIGKSINHMHINIIPDEQVGSIRVNSSDRDVYSENQYKNKTNKIKEWLKGK